MTVLETFGWRIVASQSMHTGPVPGQLGMIRTRRGSAGPGGTWVYVAWPNTCVVVQSRHAKSLGVWQRLRMTHAPAVAHRLVPGLPSIKAFGHYHKSPDVTEIIEAVQDIRDEWQMHLPVDWRVKDCLPSDNLPCLWPVFSVPRPERIDHSIPTPARAMW